MNAFNAIRVKRLSPNAWDYVIEIEDDSGGTTRLRAGVEDLDVIAAALEEKLQEMIAAAEHASTSKAR